MVKVRGQIDDPHYNYQAIGMKVSRIKSDCTGYHEEKTFTQHQANDEVKELFAAGYSIYFD